MPQDIAIVGVSAEIPGGDRTPKNLGHESFFEFLLNRGQSYEKVPAYRMNIDAWKGFNLGQISTEMGSFLKDIDLFDNVEFGVSGKDARAMAASTRKLIETCFLALADSGIDYRSQNVGCFVSGTMYELATNEFDAQGSFASAPSMMANRVSYHLDLEGPSIASDTACSASCTALHLAVTSILSGDCNAAVVAGCQLNYQFSEWFNYSGGHVLAKDGKCKPFDASADGFSRGEAVVAIVVKPLSKAMTDGDIIYGTILGTAINATGSAAPPNAPVAAAQSRAMLKAFARASKSPKELDYFECHATGTSRGDPIEANWVGEHCSRSDPLSIGSVKGNVGHTELASFLTSLSKVLSMFRHKVIPPNVNLSTRNPAIAWDLYQLHVPLVPTPLSTRSGLRSLVSIASSGIGGANAHVVLESPPDISASMEEYDLHKTEIVMLVVGGLSPRSAKQLAVEVLTLARRLESEPSQLLSLAIESSRRARQMTWRTHSLFRIKDTSLQEFPPVSLVPRKQPSVVFVFSGQGPQYLDMGRQLFATFPAFRQSVIESDKIYHTSTQKSLIYDYGLFGPAEASNISEPWPISLTLPSILIFQLAMHDLLLSIGVVPDAVLGHSAGETTVLCASGAGPRAMAIELAIARGSVLNSMESLGGTMAALGCDSRDAMRFIQLAALDESETAEIACYNGPAAIALAGSDSALDRIIALATVAGISAKKLKTKVPIHSSMMDACRDKYDALVADVFNHHDTRAATTPVISTLTGTPLTSPPGPEYFWRNARNPVLFTQALEAASTAYPDAIFIEISPHPVLSSYIADTVTMGDPSRVIACARRARTAQVELSTFLDSLGRLITLGVNSIDFNRVHTLKKAIGPDSRIPYPEYPFSRKSFPLYPEAPGIQKQFESHLGPLNHRYLHINRDTHPSLAQHIVRGEAIMPAAGFLEMVLEFGATCLIQVKFRAMFSLAAEKPVKVQVELGGSFWTVKSIASSDSAVLHADGFLSFEPPHPKEPTDLTAIKARCGLEAHESIYPHLEYALNYGPLFQRVRDVWYTSNEALVEIRGSEDDIASDVGYVIHPAIMDACFHIAGLRAFHHNLDPNVYYLPSSLQRLVLHRESSSDLIQSLMYAHCTMREWYPDRVIYDISAFNEDGSAIFSLEGLEMARHHLHHIPKPVCRYDVVQQPLDCPEAHLPRLHCGELEISRLVRDYLTQLKEHRKKLVKIFIQLPEDNPSLSTLFSGVLSQDLQLSIVYALNGPKRLLDVTNTNVHGRLVIQPSPDSSTQWHDMEESMDLAIMVPSTPSDPHSDLALASRLLHTAGAVVILDNPRLTEMANEQWEELLLQYGFSHLGPRHTSDDAESEIRIISAELQKPLQSLFSEETDHVYRYREGAEMDLQWFLSGLEWSRASNIWILASEGRDSHEASGLARSLRKESVAWTLRVVIFPTSYSYHRRFEALQLITTSAMHEMEITVANDGSILVPRLVQVPDCHPPNPTAASPGDTLTEISLPPHHLQLCVEQWMETDSSDQGRPNAFAGRVMQTTSDEFPVHTFVGGLALGRDKSDVLLIDSALVFRIKDSTACPPRMIPGLVVAALAPTTAVFSHEERFQRLRVLLTHCDSIVGETVSEIYTLRHADLVQVESSMTLVQLSRLGQGGFDLIISGYEDLGSIQICQTLLRESTGRIFLWNSGERSLANIIREEPCTTGAAIHAALPLIAVASIDRSHVQFGLPDQEVQNEESSSIGAQAATVKVRADEAVISFDPHKSYLLIGGIGSLGPHVALWMYQRGARHIILISRSGESNLHLESNKWPLRVYTYLSTRPDLDIQLTKIDASDKKQLRELINSLSYPLAGCLLMTVASADGIFSNLSSDDFETLRGATSHVWDALKSAVEVTELDFLVVFSSVTAAFGNAGQTNYGATKSVVHGAVRDVKNAFAFVCPPIADTSLIVTSRKFNKEWNNTVPEMMQWLEDAMLQLRNGGDFWLYVPELDWNRLSQTMAVTPLMGHLVSSSAQVAPVSGSGVDMTRKLIDILLDKYLDVSRTELLLNVPLTSYGLDSLLAARLSFTLEKELGFVINQIQLLANTTVQDLLDRIGANKNPAISVDPSKNISAVTMDRTMSAMEEAVAMYQVPLDIVASQSSPATHVATTDMPGLKTVLITGTTGALGAHVLKDLAQDPSVQLIYALVRHKGSKTLVTLQQEAFEREDIHSELVESPRVHLVEAYMEKPDFGFPAALLNVLHTSVTHIIHCAWKTDDFGLPLSAFGDLLRGTKSLLQLALNSKMAALPVFTFISTIGVCRFSDYVTSAPEAPISLDMVKNTGSEVYHFSGYLQSKWVAEQMIHLVEESSPLRTTIIRVGQLSGGTGGAWSSSQWFPALVKSAQFLRCLPDGTDPTSWIQVDTAAQVILEIYTRAIGILHLVHPRPVTWNTILSPIARRMDVPLVTYAEWFKGLEGLEADNNLIHDGISDEQDKAATLLEFFRLGTLAPSISRPATESMGLEPVVSLKRALVVSATLSDPCLPQIQEDEVNKWLDHWLNVGFLHGFV
ncbi:hypothetical protein K438DRAFT_1988215 [Mycena galopus ATCC 62051]|nr:hypothetical protein K438DRAFT_1988215 [Mycena galopus ATCC 62051]